MNLSLLYIKNTNYINKMYNNNKYRGNNNNNNNRGNNRGNRRNNRGGNIKNNRGNRRNNRGGNSNIDQIRIVMNYITGLNLTGDDLFKQIKKDLFPLCINVKKYLNCAIMSTNSKFSLDYMKRTNNSYIAKHRFTFKTICNGLIIDLESLALLSIFPKFCDAHCNLDSIDNKKLKQFYICKERKYGSQITLYWYNGKWIISTINGINNNNVTWNGAETFENALNSVIKYLSNNEENLESFCDKLDKNHCYTLGFTIPTYHPATNQYDLWFVESLNLSNNKRIVKKNIEFDFVTEEIINNNITIENIKDNCINAINNYINDHENSCYGYLLVNKSNNRCNILIESDLMLEIKLYGHTINYNVINEYNIDRKLYLAMQIYIFSYKRHNYLRELFKTYNEYFKLFDKYFEFIISHARTLIETNYSNVNDNKFVYEFIQHNTINLNKNDKNLEQIIKDLVIDEKYLIKHCINYPKTGTLLIN